MRPNLQIQKLIYFILLQFKKLDLRKKRKKKLVASLEFTICHIVS